MDQEQVRRINELAKKKRDQGLTKEEDDEHQSLRARYIQEFRENVRSTLDRVYVQQEDGSYKKLEKKAETAEKTDGK